ncbi:MAG TPA: hypothetical protein VIP51_05495 [Eoetvoesiella sp.]
MDNASKDFVYCGGCGADAPLNIGLNDAALDMDRAIAQEVFGLPDDVIHGLEAASIPLPPYSTDRLAANQAMTKVWAKGGEVRARLDAELTCLADMGDDTPADYRGLSTALVMMTPQAICEAVLVTVRSYKDAGWFANTREGRPAFLRTDAHGCSGRRRETHVYAVVSSGDQPAAPAKAE